MKIYFLDLNSDEMKVDKASSVFEMERCLGNFIINVNDLENDPDLAHEYSLAPHRNWKIFVRSGDELIGVQTIGNGIFRGYHSEFSNFAQSLWMKIVQVAHRRDQQLQSLISIHDVKKIMSEHPLLNACGYGFPNELRGANKEAKREKFLRQERDHLATAMSEIHAAEVFMRQLRPTKAVYRSGFCSYGLKHDAEKDSGVYVCNGALILVGLHLGFPHRLEYNVRFGIDCKSYKEWRIKVGDP